MMRSWSDRPGAIERDVTPARALADPGRGRWRAWDQVGITEAGMVGVGHGAPAGHQRIRALVRLGTLTPADVKVHVTTRSPAADVEPAAGWRRRLACAQGYANGIFVFEGYVPDRVLHEEPRPTVLVEPRDHLGGVVAGLESVSRTL